MLWLFCIPSHHVLFPLSFNFNWRENEQNMNNVKTSCDNKNDSEKFDMPKVQYRCIPKACQEKEKKRIQK